MVRKAGLFFILILALVPALCQTAGHFDGKTWWDYVKVLAADNMNGRETGSDDLRRAEAFVVDQLKQAGLQPAGDNGFYQPVKFVSRQLDERDSSLALIRDGKSESVVLGEDAYFSSRVDLAPQIEAPLVFAGYGLTIPEQDYDDLAGLNLNGKVAVVVNGSPSEIPGPLSAHFQSSAERWKNFRKAGAIGVIGIANPASMDIPWSRIALNRNHVSMVLADPKFNDSEGEQLSVVFNPAHAAQLFAGSGHSFDEIVALAKERKRLPCFPLAVSVKA